MKRLTICETRLDPFESAIVAVPRAAHVLAMGAEQVVPECCADDCSSRMATLARDDGRSHGGEDCPRDNGAGLEPTCTHREERAEGRDEGDEDQESRAHGRGRVPRNDGCMCGKMGIDFRLIY